MTILRDLIQPLHQAFSQSDLGQRRGYWFCYTLMAIILPFTSSISSNLLRCVNTVFGLDIEQSRFYCFMGSKNMPWDRLWSIVWGQVREPKTQGRLILALDDTINPKTGKNIFACSRFFDHAAKDNQKNYPWSQCVVSLGVLKPIKQRWACLPLASRFYVREKDIDNKTINACQRGEVVEFQTKHVQAAAMIEQVKQFYNAPTLITCDSWFGNFGLWKLIQQQDGSIDLLSRMRSNNTICDLPSENTDTKPRRGRPRKYGEILGSVSELADLYHDQARELGSTLYGKKQTQKVFDKIVMLRTLRCKVRVVWIYRRSRYVALFTTDLTLSVEQIIEYYAARWKIEAAFKELKQDIGSARSQTRDAYAVNNHLQMCLMASTITWQYAQRMTHRPKRQHAVNNRASFAFSDVRRSISNEAFSDDFCMGLTVSEQRPKNYFIKTIMRLIA